MFEVPSQGIPQWLVIFGAVAVPTAGALGAFLSKVHTKNQYQSKTDMLVKEAKEMKEVQERHTLLLAKHTALHEGYVSMQADVRATRDCTIRIAQSLGVDGPK